MSEIICNICKSEIITTQWWNIAKDYEGNYLCDDCEMNLKLEEKDSHCSTCKCHEEGK